MQTYLVVVPATLMHGPRMASSPVSAGPLQDARKAGIDYGAANKSRKTA